MTENERKHLEDLQRLCQLRPIDDDFMRCLFKDNIPLVEFVLRILTEKPDLVITDCEVQKSLKQRSSGKSRIKGHSKQTIFSGGFKSKYKHNT